MAPTDLWLVRHGESVANIAASRAEAEGLDVIPVDIRDADVPLSPAGRDQAAALGAWLATHREMIDTYLSSPYRRARETLQIGLRAAGSDAQVVLVDERLRDRELGILDLLTRRGVSRLHPDEMERRRHLGKFYHRPPGGESWADVALRLRSFLGDPVVASSQQAVVVAHDAVVMLMLYLLLPLEEATLLEFADSHTVLNASVTHLVAGANGWELADFSDVAHLDAGGAPVTVHPGSPDVLPD